MLTINYFITILIQPKSDDNTNLWYKAEMQNEDNKIFYGYSHFIIININKLIDSCNYLNFIKKKLLKWLAIF